MGKSKSSRKGKKESRSNIRTQDIEDFYEKSSEDALSGGPLTDVPSDSIFSFDKSRGIKVEAIPLLKQIEELEAGMKSVMEKIDYALSPNTVIVGDSGCQILHSKGNSRCTTSTEEYVSSAVALIFAVDRNKPVGKSKNMLLET